MNRKTLLMGVLLLPLIGSTKPAKASLLESVERYKGTCIDTTRNITTPYDYTIYNFKGGYYYSISKKKDGSLEIWGPETLDRNNESFAGCAPTIPITSNIKLHLNFINEFGEVKNFEHIPQLRDIRDFMEKEIKNIVLKESN